MKVSVINAFVDGNTGGNPAGVVLAADNISQGQKQAIAKKVGLSETVFVSASSTADFKLDFFTPTRQIAHCGHATIAVFSHLAQTGRITNGWLSKETIDGKRKILIKNDMAYMEQLAPKYTEIDQYFPAILDSIGIVEEQVIGLPKLVNTGNAFLILGVENAQILSQINPDLNAVQSISDALDLIGYYVFSPIKNQTERDAVTRMFAPRYGINEEAATGMAAGPLACYLFDEMYIKKDVFNIEQGSLMQFPSPSVLAVELEILQKEIVSVMAGGVAKLTKEITIDV